MDEIYKNIFIILTIISVIAINIREWLIYKGYPFRIFNLLAAVCWVAIVFTYWAGMAFEVWQLIITSLFLFFVWLFFQIKALLAKREFKKTIITEESINGII